MKITVKNTKTFLALLTPSLVLLVLPLFLHRKQGDLLDKQLQLHAGSSAIDCGRSLYPDPHQMAATDSCAVAAYKTKRPFYFRYDMQPRYAQNRQVSNGLAGNANGEVVYLEYIWQGWLGFQRKRKLIQPPYKTGIISRKGYNRVGVLGWAGKKRGPVILYTD